MKGVLPMHLESNPIICARCVMDTTDSEIRFDANGVCNHCLRYDELIRKYVITGKEGESYLHSFIRKMKEDGETKEYDCVIGVSGGVDSSFVAYQAKKLGLRPLAVHLDNGWNSELAVKNIQRLLDKLEIDLYTHVLDWEEFRDLQLAFLKASTPDSEIPSDHAIVASLFLKANEIGVRHILNGCNIRTETHLPQTWSRGHQDWRYIKGINERFGSRPLATYPHISLTQRLKYIQKLTWFPLLNYIDYRKTDALTILQNELNWKYYGGKHYESIYTRFYQGYILPKKFGFDKRRSHFSSLICSGEMKRSEALEELNKETYPLELQREDREFVIKKFEITEEEFEEIMKLPCKTFLDYPSYEKTFLQFPFHEKIQKIISYIYHRAISRNNIKSL